MKHINSSPCPKCLLIFDTFPGFYLPLKQWFLEFQSKHPEAHISEAGRGRAKQELVLKHKLSLASFGNSAHNYNAAIDVFENQNESDIYEKEWFQVVMKPELIKHPEFIWYGDPKSKFKELPHIEPKGWKNLAQMGALKIVES